MTFHLEGRIESLFIPPKWFPFPAGGRRGGRALFSALESLNEILQRFKWPDGSEISNLGGKVELTGAAA